MKPLLFVLLFLGIASLAQASPLDYVNHIETSCDSNFGSIINCHTIYSVTNPTLNPITIDTANFKFKWRTKIADALEDSLGAVRNIKLERWNGASWVNLNLGATVTLAPLTTYTIKLSGDKVWQPTGIDGEFKMENVDNVLSAFGHDYTEWAWWNTTYPYKRNATFFNPTAFTGNVSWIYNNNFSTEAENGKVDYNGTCIRIINANENGEVTFEHEPSNLSITNYTAFVFQNLPTGGVNNTVWLYYGNLGTCQEGFGNVNNLWNQTGVALTSHFAINSINSSSFLDSAGNDQNFTKIGTLPSVSTPLGMGWQKIGTSGNYPIAFGNKINNWPTGSITLWYNVSSFAGSVDQMLVVRGNNTGTTPDLVMDIATNSPSCSLDNTGTRAFNAAYDVAINTWHMITCTWNTTGLFMYDNGNFITSAAFTTGLPNNLFLNQITLGEQIGVATNQFNGSMSDIAFYNRTLSDQEIQLIYNSTNTWNSVEVFVNGTPDSNPTITVRAFDELTNLQIYFNATFSNGTSTFSFPTTAQYSNGSNNFTQGISTATFQNASYYPRQILTNITNASQTITAYLLPITNPNIIFVRIHVVDAAGLGLTNALISITKSGNIIEQKYTDSTGVASFYLDFTQTYQLSVTKSGYPSASLPNFIPVDSDYYIQLSSGSSISLNYLFANITWSLKPDPRKLFYNQSIINFTIKDKETLLQWFGLVLENNNIIIFNQSSTTAAGGTILVNVNLSNYTSGVTAHPFFKKQGYPEYYDSSAWFNFANQSESAFPNFTGLGSQIVAIKSAGFSQFSLAIALLLMGLLLSAAVARTIGVGAGFIALIILAVIALFGVFTSPNSGVDVSSIGYWAFFVWMVMVIFAIAIIRVVGV